MLFEHFEPEYAASRELCEKYAALLPAGLTEVWQKRGFGSLLDGYLKLINPDEYQNLLNDTYILGSSAVPIFVTAFADVLTWEKGRYIRIVKYKDGTFEGVAAGFGFFWKDLEDGSFDSRFFELAEYRAAVAAQGRPAFDECFGYAPLLALGGKKTAEHLRKYKTKEHISLIAQAVGKIGA